MAIFMVHLMENPGENNIYCITNLNCDVDTDFSKEGICARGNSMGQEYKMNHAVEL